MNLKDIEAQYASSAESSDSDSEAETDEGKIDASVQQNDEGLEKEENQDNIEESTEDNIPTEENASENATNIVTDDESDSFDDDLLDLYCPACKKNFKTVKS